MANITKQIAYFGGDSPLFKKDPVPDIKFGLHKRKTIVDEIGFLDPMLYRDATFETNKTYYLKFLVEPYNKELEGDPNPPKDNEAAYENNDYIIQVVLISSDTSEFQQEEQLIKEIEVKKNGVKLDENELNKRKIKVECIFKPFISGLDQITIRIKRGGVDYQHILSSFEKEYIKKLGWSGDELDPNSIYQSGRFPRIRKDSIEISTINNVLAEDTEAMNGTIKKIGIQGRPNLLFSINGEEMRLNKTGVYEISYDRIDIDHIGFVVNEAGNTDTSVILDYTYISRMDAKE